MRLSRRAYPHPVVGNRDDVDAAFQAPIEVSNDGVAYCLSVQVQTSSKTIKRLISEKRATYVLHVECSNTLYRKTFEFSQDERKFTIAADCLNATVEVNVIARSTAEIPRYRVSGSHSDYGKTTFRIDRGGILAVAESHTFDADIDFDALRYISSIMQIRLNHDPADGPIQVDLSSDKISIGLSRGDFENYKIIRANPGLSSSLQTTIVLPALLEALQALKDGESEDEGLRWHRVLTRRLESLGLDCTANSLDAAQKILELPIRRAFFDAREYIERLD